MRHFTSQQGGVASSSALVSLIADFNLLLKTGSLSQAARRHRSSLFPLLL